MSDTPKKYKLDRTAFEASNASEQAISNKEFQKLSWEERMSIEYGYELNNPPRMDKTFFQIKRRK